MKVVYLAEYEKLELKPLKDDKLYKIIHRGSEFLGKAAKNPGGTGGNASGAR